MKMLRMLLAVFCIAVIAVCAVLLLSRLGGRMRVADMTAQKRYTLSDGTRNVLAKIDQPITLRLYFSQATSRRGSDPMADWNIYFLYIRDLLQEYVDVADGRIRLEVIDPRIFSEEEDEAIEAGIRRFQLGERESFFFGLAARSDFGRTKVIPFFDRRRDTLVEYDITKCIADLIRPEKRTIGVVSSLPVLGADLSPFMMQMYQMQNQPVPQPWIIMEILRESYDVRMVEEAADGRIPADIDLLLVMHPKEMEDEMLFAIDQFVMEGRPAIFLLDPFCIADEVPGAQQQPWLQRSYWPESWLDDLLEAWGVSMQGQQIAVDATLGIPIPVRQNAPPVVYPPYMQLRGEAISKDEPILAQVDSLQMLYAGILEPVPSVEGVEVVSLLQTTPEGGAWIVRNPSEVVAMNQDAIRRSTRHTGRPLSLAVMIRGELQTNFPDGIDILVDAGDEADGEAKPDGDTEGSGHDASGTAPDDGADAPEDAGEPERGETVVHLPVRRTRSPQTRIAVIADLDFLADQIAFQRSPFGVIPLGQNVDFFLNLVDALGGDMDLVSIRGRGQMLRSLRRIEAMKAEADRATEEEMERLNTVIQTRSEALDEITRKVGSGGDRAILASEMLREREAIEQEIREARREMRKLQSETLRKVEALEWRMLVLNCALAPGLLLLLGVGIALVRVRKARLYQARRESK